MAVFADLPLELLPLVIEHVVKASHLAKICLVNRRFYEFTTLQLYGRIIIRHWYKDVKNKVYH